MDKSSVNHRFSAYLAWGLLGLYVITIVIGYLLQVWAKAPTNALGTYDSVFFGPPFFVMAAIGALVVSRLPGSRIGWLLCALPLIFSVTDFLRGYAYFSVIAYPGSLPAGVPAALLYGGIFFQATLPFTLLFLLFPNGRLLSPRWAIVGWTAAGASALLFVGGVLDTDLLRVGRDINPLIDEALRVTLEPLFVLAFILQFLTLPAAAVSMALRLRSARGAERQQLKWFVYSLAFLPVGFGLFFFGRNDLIAAAITEISVIGMSVAIGIAIFKYRLYAVDLIINRSLVYGPLTAALALVYAGCVIGLQNMFRALTGNTQSELVTVLSTLAIAALFNPLRRRVQDFIDRRFYRQKYNAERILERFASIARDETDIARLTAELLAVVDQTMQPESVSLWLKDPHKKTT